MFMASRGRRNLVSKFGILLTVALVIVLTFSGCKSSSGSSHPLTKQQAIQTLLDNVIKPSSLDHQVIALTLAQALPAGTKVSPYAPDPLPVNVTSLPNLVDQLCQHLNGSSGWMMLLWPSSLTRPAMSSLMP